MRHAVVQMHSSGFSASWQRHDDRFLQAQSCSLLPSDAGHDLPFCLGAGRSSRSRRAVAVASFLETLKAEATHTESGRSRGPPTAFGGFSHPQRHKMQWDSKPLDVRDSSDDLIIDREDEDYPPEPEELDDEIGPVIPLYPPKPSAIGDLRGESDGPRPASHLLPLEKDDEAAIPSFAAAPQTEEASGYVKETRLDVLDKWPPPPREDGDADLPAGPVPSVKLYAEHRYADAEKANESWSELLRQHEEAKEAATAKPTFEVHLKDDAAEQDQDSSGELYNSPNADNVIPPELRTGLERKHLVLSHFSARYARTSEADQSIPDPAQKLGDEAREILGDDVKVTVAQDFMVLRGDHFDPEQELAVKKYPWHRETSVWPTKSGYTFPASSRQLAMGRLLPGRPRAERRALTSLALASVLIGISWTWSATCFGGKKKSKDVPADEKARIISILGREVVDSRGNPTVEAELTTGYGTVRAVVPSGASTGIYEALELRDGGSRYEGQGVSKAVNNINRVIAPKLKGKDVRFQKDLDELMIFKLDGTENQWGHPKAKLGANAILAVSMAICRAGAEAFGLELFEYIGELKETNFEVEHVDVQRARHKKYKMPVPMMNVINGGRHAGNKLPMQEFMISPTGAKTFKEALQIGSEVYHSLKNVVVAKYGKSAAAVGDEGGFAPNIQENDEGLQALVDAIKEAGHTGKVKLAMDIAASEFYSHEDKTYNLGFKVDNPAPSLVKNKDQLMEFYKDIISRYPIVSIEDPFDQDDWEAYGQMVQEVGKDVQIVGDDLLVTNPKRIEYAKEHKAANALLLKVNQIGSISEAVTAYLDSHADGWGVMVSHRSGETEDTFIADLAVGLSTGQIKTGAPCRSERVAKYNQLLRIEEYLGRRAYYAGDGFRDS
ncbi:ENO1 [Symbiodinium sp. CCMP2592]|nr:ENO1 [Symbiodinium sp. CCMP2592]